MKIELKNIKIAQWASEETTCYHADVFIDGKKSIHASNAGHGGCDEFNFYDGFGAQDLRAVNEWVADNIAPSGPFQADPAKRELYDNGSPADLESLIGAMISDWELDKAVKRKAKKIMEIDDGKLMLWNAPASPANLAAVRAKHPQKEFINDRLDDPAIMARARIAMGGPSNNDAEGVFARARENRLTAADANWLMAQDTNKELPVHRYQELRAIVADGARRQAEHQAASDARRAERMAANATA